MFVINTDITVNFLLANTVNSIVYSDFDVRITKPDGDSVFIQSAILEDKFIAPTPNTTGAVSYEFTPDVEGVWVVVLSVGEPNHFQIYHEYFLRISEPDTHIIQQVVLG